MTIVAATGQSFSADAGPYATGLGTAVTVMIVDLATGGTALTETNSGITEITDLPGVYRKTFPALDAGYYSLIWNDGSDLLAEENLRVSTTSSPPGVIVGANPGVITIDGVTALETFTIKRYDTLPLFDVKLRYASGATPTIGTADTIYINMRLQSDGPAFAGTPKVHALMTHVDDADGRVRYAFTETDTNTAGLYYAEVEINHVGGSIETFPQLGYVAVRVIADLDPGIDP